MIPWSYRDLQKACRKWTLWNYAWISNFIFIKINLLFNSIFPQMSPIFFTKFISFIKFLFSLASSEISISILDESYKLWYGKTKLQGSLTANNSTVAKESLTEVSYDMPVITDILEIALTLSRLGFSNLLTFRKVSNLLPL